MGFAVSERLFCDANPNPLYLGSRASLQKSRTQFIMSLFFKKAVA